MCYLLLVFALGGAAEQPRCDACDKVDCPGAVGGACPHFRDARGRPLPRVQPHPSAEQLTADKNDSSREPIIAKGVVVPMDGEKLRCFYNSIVAGLRHCGHVCAAELSTVPSLRRCLADFLSGPLAPLIRINNAETLAEAALRDGTSMDQMATDIQCDGAQGIGGSEAAAITSGALVIDIFTWQRYGRGRFRLMESATQLAPTTPTGTVHLVLKPGSPFGHYDLLRLTQPMPALAPLKGPEADQRRCDVLAWAKAVRAARRAATLPPPPLPASLPPSAPPVFTRAKASATKPVATKAVPKAKATAETEAAAEAKEAREAAKKAAAAKAAAERAAAKAENTARMEEERRKAARKTAAHWLRTKAEEVKAGAHMAAEAEAAAVRARDSVGLRVRTVATSSIT